MENEVIVSTKKGDYKIEIIHDESPVGEGPRKDWENLGVMVCWHSRYNLGDKNGKDYGTPTDFLLSICGVSEDDLTDEQKDDVKYLFDLASNENVILPLFLYDHSGITMNTTGFSCPWDSGQVGYIYASKEDICKNWGITDWQETVKNGKGEMIRADLYTAEILKSEVETYDQWLRGEIYGYKVYRPDEEDDFDSCWGFYGSDHEISGLLEQAKDAIEADAQD